MSTSDLVTPTHLGRTTLRQDDGLENDRVRVLLIEDEHTEAELIHQALEGADWVDFDLSMVGCLEAGLEHLVREGFDIVVVDLSLPDSQGLSTIDALLPLLGDAALVATAADANPLAAMAAVQRGAEDYLVKGARRGAELARSLCFSVERKRRERRLERRANSDPLTGLANRSVFDRALEEACHGHGAGNIAVLYLDVDDFKHVNDRLGHAAGDHALRCLASRLLAVAREGDVVARRGGDEFVVLLRGVLTQHAVMAAAFRLRDAASRPLTVIDGRPLVLRVSIGGALGPGAADSLVSRADSAMYRAKREGFGVSLAGLEGRGAAASTRRHP